MSITQSTELLLEYGEFQVSYHQINDAYCISVSYGDLQNIVPIVRIHSSCLFGEAFQDLTCDCGAQLRATLKLIKRNKSGVVVYRFMEGRGVGLEAKIKAIELQRTQKVNTVDAFRILGFEPDLRDYHVEVSALQELGINTHIKLASQNPNKRSALEQVGFILDAQISLPVKITRHNIEELLVKRDLLGHTIELGPLNIN